MHILLAILGVIGVLGTILIRMGMAARGASEIADAAQTAVGAVNRAKFKRKATRSPLTTLDDPREAVAALMVAIAKVEGDLTDKQIKVMEALIKNRLDFEGADELIAHARWLVQETAEPGVVVTRVQSFLSTQCTYDQKRDIIEILETVASINGPADTLQTQAIRQLMFAIGAEKRPPQTS